MYLTNYQVQSILKNSFYSDFVTETDVKYVFYRGRMNATVHTLRFNFNDKFNENSMLEHIIQYLLNRYNLNTKLMGSIGYDLLLKDPNSVPTSFYLWRANSNAVHTLVDNEHFFDLTYNNLFRFIRSVTNINVNDLNIFFRSSNVTIERIVAIVFTFVAI